MRVLVQRTEESCVGISVELRDVGHAGSEESVRECDGRMGGRMRGNLERVEGSYRSVGRG